MQGAQFSLHKKKRTEALRICSDFLFCARHGGPFKGKQSSSQVQKRQVRTERNRHQTKT